VKSKVAPVCKTTLSIRTGQ